MNSQQETALKKLALELVVKNGLVGEDSQISPESKADELCNILYWRINLWLRDNKHEN